MERLTERMDDFYGELDEIAFRNPDDPEGMYSLSDIVKWSDDEKLYEIADRLASYEDTGLMPGEILRLMVMDFRAKMAKQLRQGTSPERLDEILQAEREGRLVVLPCKVGDTVYLIKGNYIEETKIRTFFMGHPSYSRGESDPSYYMVRCTNFDIAMSNFGKTVFLTRAEAEAALKGCDSDD